jgi:hypothetical protein
MIYFSCWNLGTSKHYALDITPEYFFYMQRVSLGGTKMFIRAGGPFVNGASVTFCVPKQKARSYIGLQGTVCSGSLHLSPSPFLAPV